MSDSSDRVRYTDEGCGRKVTGLTGKETDVTKWRARSSKILKESKSIHEILEKFLLRGYRSQTERSWQEWIAYIFDLKDKVLDVYWIRESIDLNGMPMDYGRVCGHKRTYRGYRGGFIFTRYLKSKPDFIEIEMPCGPGRMMIHFTMPHLEFKAVKHKLEYVKIYEKPIRRRYRDEVREIRMRRKKVPSRS